MKTKLFLMATSAALFLSAMPSLASQPGNNGGGNGGCGVGQQTNGCGSPSTSGGNATAVAGVINDSFNTSINNSIKVDDHSIKNTNTATGGAGGNAVAFGGSGGSGGSADVRTTNTNVIAPDIRNTTTDFNHVDNRDTNINGQHQGQGQQQGQGQSQSASSDQRQTQSLTDSSTHTLTATTGPSTSSASAPTTVAPNQSVTFISEAQKRSPVSSAYAAPLSIGSGVCMYTPVSASGQGITIGLSGSVARRDDECERRSTADMFARVGMTFEACQIMAMAPHARAAGIVCTRPAPVVVVSPPPPPPVIGTPLAKELPAPVTPPEKGTERGAL